MVPETVRTYLLHSLEATPQLLARLVSPRPGMPTPMDLLRMEMDWDGRPDPDRFTMREMVAHLADWEEIWLERVNRIATEDNPTLASVDEGKVAQDRNYSKQSYGENLVRFAEGRQKLVD